MSTVASVPRAAMNGPPDRLALGVAARLSRYLQVLTQARKMGRETISSQELAAYTHVNSTQIRRDLSGFGRFGKRGVGYNIDSLVPRSARSCGPPASTTSRCSARATSAARSPARTSSATTASGSPRCSTTTRQGRRAIGDVVRHPDDLGSAVEDEEIVVAVLAVPRARRSRSPTSSSTPA